MCPPRKRLDLLPSQWMTEQTSGWLSSYLCVKGNLRCSCSRVNNVWFCLNVLMMLVIVLNYTIIWLCPECKPCVCPCSGKQISSWTVLSLHSHWDRGVLHVCSCIKTDDSTGECTMAEKSEESSLWFCDVIKPSLSLVQHKLHTNNHRTTHSFILMNLKKILIVAVFQVFLFSIVVV